MEKSIKSRSSGNHKAAWEQEEEFGAANSKVNAKIAKAEEGSDNEVSVTGDESDESDETSRDEDNESDSDYEYVEVDKIIQLLQLAMFHPETGQNLCQTISRVADSIDKNTKVMSKMVQHFNKSQDNVSSNAN